jgi:hypothetical protein
LSEGRDLVDTIRHVFWRQSEPVAELFQPPAAGSFIDRAFKPKLLRSLEHLGPETVVFAANWPLIHLLAPFPNLNTTILLRPPPARKWRLAGERLYVDLVDVEEVRALCAAITVARSESRISTTSKVAAALIKYGFLKTITRYQPRQPLPDRRRACRESNAWRSIRIAGRAGGHQGRHFLTVKKEFDTAGTCQQWTPKGQDGA